MARKRPFRRPKNLIQFTAWLIPEAKNRLSALSRIDGIAAYRILEDGFWRLWMALPPERRQAAEIIARICEDAAAEES